MGEEDSDIIHGGDGHELIYGAGLEPNATGDGSNWIYGEGGNDVLDGGLGYDWDYVKGGSGYDRAAYRSYDKFRSIDAFFHSYSERQPPSRRR